MSAYSVGQELNDLHWGTGMPVILMIGSEIVRVRARGNYSLVVTDPQKLEERTSQPDVVRQWVGNYVVNTVNETFAEFSSKVGDVNALFGLSEDLLKSMREKLDPAMENAGLRLKTLSILAIEKM